MKEGEKSRVLFFNYEYPPLGGGAANATAYLLKAYQNHPDLEVDLITASPDDKNHTIALSSGITVHMVAIGKNSASLHHQTELDLICYSFKAYRLAKTFFRTKKYDVIHAFFTVPCGALARRLGKKFGVPYIVSLRGSDVPGYSERFSFLYVFLTPFIKRIWKGASFVISNSQGLKALALSSAPNQKIGIIPNGVDTEKFFPASENTTNEWILTAGATRLTERKGLHLIIEALPKLIAINPHTIFEVMGDGSALAKLEDLTQNLGVADHVRFLGRIPATETNTYYQRAKVFILPSANEGMSNALLEALASGLPAVVTDTGGSSELVEDGKNGFIIPRTSEAIVKAVSTLLNDDALARRMGKESRARAEAQSWESVAREYVELYQKAKRKS